MLYQPLTLRDMLHYCKRTCICYSSHTVNISLLTDIKIIRGYRKHQKTRTDKSDLNQRNAFKEDEDDSGSDSDDNNKRKKSEYRKPWKESTVAAPIIDSDVKIGKIVFLLVDTILAKLALKKVR